MSAASKAVFLSYASQDAAAVLRLAEALRAAGIVVWFDKDELTGGDAWDAKIRKQIADCALFVPVISAATEARREGYFRLEWKLAAQRTHMIADGTPFLLPVVIDATREAEALVPAEFRAVQWTRLREGDGGQARDEAAEKFCARVGRLLGGGAALQPAPETSERELKPRATPAKSHRVPAAVWASGTVLVAAVLAGGGYFWLRRPPEAAPGSTPPADAGTRPTALRPAHRPIAENAPAARAWPRGAELKRVIALLDGLEATMEDFRLAEEIATRALNQAPADPETVTVMARVHSAFVLRNFDFRAERNALAKKYGERAVQLAPGEPEALVALAVFLTERGANAVRAAELARRATELVPGEPRYWRAYARAVESQNRLGPEGLALAEQNAMRFPRDALTRYELSIAYRFRERWAEFEREIDATLALAPLANAINWKARAALLRGDLAEMRQWLDRVPARARTEERTVIGSIIYASLSGDYDYALAALQGFAEPWFYDAFNYSGPTALPRAEILARQGKPGLARVHYEAALAELKRRQAESPSDFTGRAAEIWTLLGLGRREEALALHRTALEGMRRPWRVTGLASWWFDVIPRALLVGDRESALALLRDSTVEAEGRRVIKLRMKWDPRMAPFREDPQIVALLAEPVALQPEDGGRKTAAGPALGSPTGPSEAAPLAARALAMITKIGFTRDDLPPAEDFARRATELQPDSAAAWGVRAGVQSAWIFRNWDYTEKRRQDTQALANRALALDPNEPEALLALGHVLTRQRAYEQAETLLRRASAAHPDHVRLARALGFSLGLGGREADARAVYLAAIQRAPRDPLLRYELAMTYGDYGRVSAEPDSVSSALAQLDAAIGLQPFSSPLLLKAVLLAGWRGDLAGMRAALAQHDTLPLLDRSEDRAVFVAMWAGLIERQPARVEAAAALTARNYFEDAALPLRLKAWTLALAHEAAGKVNSARSNWQAAAAVLRQRLKEEPTSEQYQVELATTLAWLDQRDEAERLAGLVEPLWRENRKLHQDAKLARYYSALGDARRAAPYLAPVVDQSPFTSRHVILLDPWWDKIRGTPEFKAATQGPKTKP